MDAIDLEERFRERVAAYRREYFRFTLAAAIVTVAVVAGVWYGLSWVIPVFAVSFFGFFLGADTGRLVTAAVMAVIFAGGLIGFLKTQGQLTAEEEMAKRGGGSWWMPSFRGPFILLLPFHLVATLPFILIREVVTGRRLLASDRAVRTALELLAAGGAKIDRRSIAAKSAEDEEATRGAIRLLVEMKLFFVKGKGPDLHLVRTLEGQEFLEARPSGRPDR